MKTYDMELAANVCAARLTAAGGKVTNQGTLEILADGNLMIRDWSIDGYGAVGFQELSDAAEAAMREQGWAPPPSIPTGMKLELNVTLDANDMTLLEFAALTDRVKVAVDPDGNVFRRRFVRMRLGNTGDIPQEQAKQFVVACAAVGELTAAVVVDAPLPPDHLEEQRASRGEILHSLEALETNTAELLNDELKEDLKIGPAMYLLKTHRLVCGAMREYLRAEDAVEAKANLAETKLNLAENPAVR